MTTSPDSEALYAKILDGVTAAMRLSGDISHGSHDATERIMEAIEEHYRPIIEERERAAVEEHEAARVADEKRYMIEALEALSPGPQP